MINAGSYSFGGVHEYSFSNPYDDDDCAGYYIMLNDDIYSFKHNSADGYRSYCDVETLSERPENIEFNFENNPFQVYIETFDDGDGFTGIKILSEDKVHELAEMGTNYAADYYPSCEMHMNIPKINELYFYDLVTEY